MGVRVFEKDGATWTERAKLLPPGGSMDATYDYAHAVAIDGDRILASDPYAAINGEIFGRIYVFARDTGGTWAYESDFNPQFSGAFPHAIGFGYTLALRGERIAVGVADTCPYVSVYEYATSHWANVATLDPHHNACSGYSANVAMKGDHIAIGASGHPSDEPLFRIPGAGYIFDRGAAGWNAMAADQIAPDGAISAGSSIVLRDDEMLLGAPGQSLVYAYRLSN
jgi:hypothetical protein